MVDHCKYDGGLTGSTGGLYDSSILPHIFHSGTQFLLPAASSN
jgi:hypothetical protein